jgi:GNAT superfamily N-acetyltransferase
VAPRIELLADHPDAVLKLGHWMHAEWPTPGRSVADRAGLFMLCMNRDRVPMTLVALDGEELAGTVSLLDRSVVSHEHLHPWVASLYVAAAWRHAGLATRLVDAAALAARRLGLEALFMGVAAGARAHYEQHGWQRLGEGRGGEDTREHVEVLKKLLF